MFRIQGHIPYKWSVAFLMSILNAFTHTSCRRIPSLRSVKKENEKMDAMNEIIVKISDVVWNYLLLFLLVGTGETV